MTDRQSMRLVARWETPVFGYWFELRHDGKCYRAFGKTGAALTGRKFSSDSEAIESTQKLIDQVKEEHDRLGKGVRMRRIDEPT